MNVIAILDIGKTNKKLFLFDEHYKIVWEQSDCFSETMDDEGHSGEDLAGLTAWIKGCLRKLSTQTDYTIRAVNFSAYGASFVHIDREGQAVAPLYNYLKPYPEQLKKKFYDTYGGEITFSMLTASPVLGSLNSGMQLYRIKEEKEEIFDRIATSLHLPQYASFLLTNERYSDITSIGCHTNLWNFSQHGYHEWVYREGIIDKLPPILPSVSVVRAVLPGGNAQAGSPVGGSSLAGLPLVDPSVVGSSNGAPSLAGSPVVDQSIAGSPIVDASLAGSPIVAGIGLHDSSSAMIPYLESFREPFVLISTGTWCISMNPFNDTPLTVAELQKDCLCYLSYQGHPVKASRLFAGYEHEQQVKRLAAHFHTEPSYANTIEYEPDMVAALETQDDHPMARHTRDGKSVRQTREENPVPHTRDGNPLRQTRNSEPVRPAAGLGAQLTASVFAQRDLHAYTSFEQAYHRLIMDIMDLQVASTRMVLTGTDVKRIFVDGGFGKNQVYMNLLACAFPNIEVYAASISQATAMGAALAIHKHWNSRPLPGDIIELKYYVACKS